MRQFTSLDSRLCMQPLILLALETVILPRADTGRLGNSDEACSQLGQLRPQAGQI